jgi:hypothetical protein
MKSRDEVDSIDNSRNIVNEVYDKQNKEMLSDFMDYFVRYIDYNVFNLFQKERDRQIADSLAELFRTRDNLYSYNKKALYILIRERTNVQTQYITRVVGKLKLIYAELYSDYMKGDILSITHRLEEFND